MASDDCSIPSPLYETTDDLGLGLCSNQSRQPSAVSVLINHCLCWSWQCYRHINVRDNSAVFIYLAL